MSPNRLVALLTPFAAVLAGAAANWLAQNFPGVDISASSLNEIFISGMVAVIAPSAVWLNGWQKHEARESAAADYVGAALAAGEPAPAAGVPGHPGPALEPTLGELGDLDESEGFESEDLDAPDLDDLDESEDLDAPDLEDLDESEDLDAPEPDDLDESEDLDAPDLEDLDESEDLDAVDPEELDPEEDDALLARLSESPPSGGAG